MEIYRIIQSFNTTYSENNNGTFFNLTTLPEEAFEQIDKFVDFCFENKTELDEYDQKLNECKYRNNINNMVKSVSFHTSSIREPMARNERWKELMEDVKENKGDMVKEFVEKINNPAGRLGAKRSTTMYLMARKRFQKRSVPEVDLCDELDHE